MRKSLLLCFLSCSLFSQAQLDSLKFSHLFSIPISADAIVSDHLGNVYAISEWSEIRKYDPKGNLSHTFNGIGKGKITTLDATNPLKLVVFYEDYQEIITLDNTLSVSGQYKLQTNQDLNISVVGSARDNLAWVYDRSDDKLIKLDAFSRPVSKGIQLSGFHREGNGVYFIKEKDNLIYLSDSINGILIFDNYGTLYEHLPVEFKSPFQVFSSIFYYLRDNQLHLFDSLSATHKAMPLPDGMRAKSGSIQKGKLFLLNDKGIVAYGF